MKDLSLHILDIVQNSIHAGASKIEISIIEENKWLKVFVKDNGSGIDEELMDKVTDPFYSTGNKRTGLGIPLLAQNAELCGGNLNIESEKGKGTIITADFIKGHIDMLPLGDIAKTMKMLIFSYPDKHFTYFHQVDNKKFSLDTIEIREILGEDIDIKSGEVLKFIDEMITENLVVIGAKWPGAGG